MALVNLKNVKVYATFSKGFRVVEEFTSRDGQTHKVRWTVWADASQSGPIREGDIVSLSGFLSARVNDWTDKDGNEKHSVELSINSPRMTDGDRSQPPAEEPWAASAPAGDVWNQPVVDDSEVPF